MQDEQPIAYAGTMKTVERYYRQLKKTVKLFFSHARGFNTTCVWTTKVRVETEGNRIHSLVFIEKLCYQLLLGLMYAFEIRKI